MFISLDHNAENQQWRVFPPVPIIMQDPTFDNVFHIPSHEGRRKEKQAGLQNCSITQYNVLMYIIVLGNSDES